MKKLNPIIPILILYSLVSINFLNANNTLPPTKFFPADIKEGLIGKGKEIVLDNPNDNIFHINITQNLRGDEKVCR